jgi:Ca2+-binding RTX toxin-like protein
MNPYVSRVRLTILGLAAAALLVLPSGAASRITKATLSNGILTLTGTGGADNVSVRKIPGLSDPTASFYEISDPKGVKELPTGCFRFDKNTIHCPVELVNEIDLDLGNGDDTLEVDEGVAEDFGIKGGDGDDTLAGGSGDDEIEGEEGNDVLDGNRGNDVREGGPGNDRLKGSPGKDVAKGGSGNDKVNGGGGADRLKGNSGRDTLKGGGGDDRLNGGGGRDKCVGGPGSETVAGCETGYGY